MCFAICLFICLFVYFNSFTVNWWSPSPSQPIRTFWCSFVFLHRNSQIRYKYRLQSLCLSVALSLMLCNFGSLNENIQKKNNWIISRSDCHWKLNKLRLRVFDIATCKPCKFHVISGNCGKRSDEKRRNRYLLHEFAWFPGQKIKMSQFCWVSTLSKCPGHFNHFQQLKQLWTEWF